MTLLASSSKSGELRVVSGHVEGRLWLHEGQLVQSGVGKATGHVDAMFELLRLSDGNFVFRDGVEATDPAEPTPVMPVVRAAQQRLQEWRQIEAVVPTLEHRVRLVAELPGSEVTLSAGQWQLVIAVALAGTVRGVVEELAVDYFDGCRGIKGLVDANLVLVEAPRVRSASESTRAGRRSANSASDGPAAADHAESRDEHALASLESLVASASAGAGAAPSRVPLTPSSPPSPSSPLSPTPTPWLEPVLASSVKRPDTTLAAAATPAAASEVRLATDAEPIRVVRHEEPEEDENKLATVRHLFLSSPETEPQPDFDWQSWSRGPEPRWEPGAPATKEASIHSLRPLPTGPASPTAGLSPFGSPVPVSPPSVSPGSSPAPALAVITPVPLSPSSPATVSPLVSSFPALASVPAPAPAGAPAAAVPTEPAKAEAPVAPARTAPSAATAAPAATGALPLATAPGRSTGQPGAGRGEETETINRGLLLKFLSSVKP